MNITISLPISDDDVKRAFFSHLEKLTEGRWIDNGYLYEEQYTSHRFDHKVGSIEDPQYTVCVAAIRLQQALSDQIKKRGQNA